jgi:hypothetical protein
MKKILVVLFLVSYILPIHTTYATEQQDQDAVLQSFQPITKKFTDFFKKNPKLLSKVSPPKELKATAYCTTDFFMEMMYYDILKTNSIVTPYSAFIDIDTDVFDNKNCGNVAFDKKNKDGWSTIDEAIKNHGNKNCFISRTKDSGPIRHRFNFQYQARDKKWIMTNITYQDGKINGRFMALLGVVSPWFAVMDEPQAQELNKGWIDLFKNF